MGKLIDLTGQKFGRLTVIERAENKSKRIMWLCECKCGNKTIVSSDKLRSGHTTSCGCYQKERAKTTNTTHGLNNDRLYSVWLAMKKRCCNKNDSKYEYYGGKGISVCDEWLHDFQAFYDWSINNGYADDLTIDRIDNNKGYSPDNCRWIGQKEQCNNKTNNRFITYNDKTQTIAQWAEELGINYHTLYSRIFSSHWTIEKALNTP